MHTYVRTYLNNTHTNASRSEGGTFADITSKILNLMSLINLIILINLINLIILINLITNTLITLYIRSTMPAALSEGKGVSADIASKI